MYAFEHDSSFWLGNAVKYLNDFRQVRSMLSEVTSRRICLTKNEELHVVRRGTYASFAHLRSSARVFSRHLSIGRTAFATLTLLFDLSLHVMGTSTMVHPRLCALAMSSASNANPLQATLGAVHTPRRNALHPH